MKINVKTSLISQIASEINELRLNNTEIDNIEITMDEFIKLKKEREENPELNSAIFKQSTTNRFDPNSSDGFKGWTFSGIPVVVVR